MNTTRYKAHGSVRGSCGHNHRSITTANACAERDASRCESLGGGAYSDRRVVRCDGRSLDDDERAELAQIGEETRAERLGWLR